MAPTGHRTSNLIKRIRMEICDVQKPSLQFPWWPWIATNWISRGPLNLNARLITVDNMATLERRVKNKEKGTLKLTRGSRCAFQFGGILIVQLEWSLDLGWRAQDHTEPKV